MMLLQMLSLSWLAIEGSPVKTRLMKVEQILLACSRRLELRLQCLPHLLGQIVWRQISLRNLLKVEYLEDCW